MAPEQIVRANGVDLCVQTFGDRSDPAILLIHGAGASMLAWDTQLCERLADGRFVIRYDHRDTGRSVSYPPGAPPYTLRDLTADAIGILDVLRLRKAHLVGVSMGGGIAMLGAIEAPQRVETLTLVATSPGGPGLPPLSKAFLDYVNHPPKTDWSDREAALDAVMDLLRIFAGGSKHFDETEMRRLVGHDLDRTTNVASSQINHFAMAPAPPLRSRLGEIRAPTLVVHGAADPVFPLGHGRALAQEIPGAELLVLEEPGHLLLRPSWDVFVPALLAHTAPRNPKER
jgi:pimeloyl-ACP methyl ester carboxylesterase